MRTSRARYWEFGIERAWTARGPKSRRPSRSRTSRSRARCCISPSTRCAGVRTTTPSSYAFGRPRHGRQRRHTMHMSSLVVDKARQLAAAGHHAEVVEYLGAQKRSELVGSPTLALLYGTAQARLGRHDEGLRWLDLALDEARRRDERAVQGDRKSTRLNSSHGYISYAVFCLKKKKTRPAPDRSPPSRLRGQCRCCRRLSSRYLQRLHP